MASRRRSQIRLGWLVASLLGLSTLVVPVAWVLIPHVHRWSVLRHLTSPDLDQRDRALNHVLRHAADDRRVLEGTLDHLAVEDEQNFLQIVNALDRAGVWKRPPIPPEPWLRWLTLAARGQSPESRTLTCQRLADLFDLADDQRVWGLLKRLARDSDADVRYNALVASARLWGASAQKAPYGSIISSHATRDTEPVIARHAWLLSGLTGSHSAGAGGPKLSDWAQRPPEVSQAMVWAALRARPKHPQVAIEVLDDPSSAPEVRAVAAYALHMSPTPEAAAALGELGKRFREPVSESDRVLLWRAGLSIEPGTDAAAAFKEWTSQHLSNPPAPQADTWPLLLGFANRYAAHVVEQHPGIFARETILGGIADQGLGALVRLALLEGLPRGRIEVALDESMPELVRLAGLSVQGDPRPGDFGVLMESQDPALRDLACVLAADSLGRPQLRGLTTDLLKSFNDQAKMSGAILAGLTGIRPRAAQRAKDGQGAPAQVDLLDYVGQYPRYEVQQIVRLANWMQGRGLDEQMAAAAMALVSRDDLPSSTIYLAMLHRGRPEAISWLLAPQGEVDVEQLLDLLVRRRWWNVLRRFLPPDAPPLWLWADPGLQVFQLEILRDWWLLNQHREGGVVERWSGGAME